MLRALSYLDENIYLVFSSGNPKNQPSLDRRVSTFVTLSKRAFLLATPLPELHYYTDGQSPQKDAETPKSPPRLLPESKWCANDWEFINNENRASPEKKTFFFLMEIGKPLHQTFCTHEMIKTQAFGNLRVELPRLEESFCQKILE